MNQIINFDSRELIKAVRLEGRKVQTTITSPPYFDMKDYGVDGQIGFGQKYDDYLIDLQKVFSQVYDITKDNGTLWIIIDTFKRNNAVVTLPFDLVQKLKETGWLLQEIIIWKKDKTVPWSSKGFMQRKFEYILFFSKNKEYKTNKDNVRVYDTSQLKRWWVKYPERYNPRGKALDEIWEFPIPVQGSWGNEYIRHFCPLPKEMVATMISISTDENDIVFDPFAGSGTVMSQSAYMKREYLGIELNRQYISMFNKYLEQTLDKGRKEYQDIKNGKDQETFEETILNLRSLKYGRILVNSLEKRLGNDSLKIYVDRPQVNERVGIEVKYTLFSSIDDEVLKEQIKELISTPPLSKYGITPIFSFKSEIDLNCKNVFLYSKTNSHSYMRNAEITNINTKVISPIEVDIYEKDYE